MAKPRVRVPAIGVPASKNQPTAAFFSGGKSSFIGGWAPQLRENRHDVAAAWHLSAGRAIEALHNSGFIAGILEVASASTVGEGLKLSARPDGRALGWTPEATAKFRADIESAWAVYSTRPIECDAGGSLTIGQMQQAAFASYLAFGEVLAMLPIVQRVGVKNATKVAMIPPLRLADKTSEHNRLHQGVRVDAWGLPQSYILRNKTNIISGSLYEEQEYSARDRDGRPNIAHIKDPAIATTRGISPLAPVMKVYKQFDQYTDANLTTMLIQTMFAATMKTNVRGLAGFEGLMTENDAAKPGSLIDVEQFAEHKAKWYDDVRLDLSQHGRIAHLMPGDELDFKAAITPNSQYDTVLRWLMMEICRCAGVTYENGTGDYRGATYSSVRMASAVEWLTVMRRRSNIIIPFCQTAYENFVEEEVSTGRVALPGGVQSFRENKGLICHALWTGPPKPQADEFKAARAQQVRKEMGATTLSEIAADYGQDWDDMLRQQKMENDLADELDLPRPWAITDPMQKPEGEKLALNAPEEPSGEKKDRARKTTASPRDPSEDREPNAIEDETEAEVARDLGLGDGDD